MLGPAILWLIAVAGAFVLGIRYARACRPIDGALVLAAFCSALGLGALGFVFDTTVSALIAIPVMFLLAFALEARPRRARLPR